MLTVDIVTPAKTVYSGNNVALVSAPATLGRVGILPGHMPLVSTLEPGELHVVETGGGETRMQGSAGFLQVKDNHVIILVEETR